VNHRTTAAPGTPVPVVLGARNAVPLRTDEEMPTSGPLVDQFGRVHSDLRISVTDRCNLRCTYCLPEEVVFRPREEILQFDEITRIASVAKSLGVDSIRLTGGEPMMRARIIELVASLNAIGFSDLAMTTNGITFAPVADDFAAAGLRRINISCDSLQPDRFAAIRRRGTLEPVLGSMDAAEAAGITPVKINVVLMADDNHDEILDFAAFARSTGRVVRFIEFMPLDAGGHWQRDRVISSEHVFQTINAKWPLRAIDRDLVDPAPATRFSFVDGTGEIGLISSVTQPFCGTCNRLRLTADGAVRNCLFSDDERTLRDIVRDGGEDADIARQLRLAVWGKKAGHGINDPDFLRPARSMSMIGG
jgi:cyclic pyranopterin phosphate synthase